MKSEDLKYEDVQALFPEYELRNFGFERTYSTYNGEVVNTFKGIFVIGDKCAAFAFNLTDEEFPRAKPQVLLNRIEKGIKDYISS